MRIRWLLVRRYWRLCAACLVLGVVVIGELGLAYRTTRANQATDEAVEVDESIIDLAVEAQSAVVDMETGYRGFLLTGQDAFLEPYTRGQTTFASDVRQLEQLTASDVDQVARWQTIERLVDAWQADIAEPTIARRRTLAGANALAEIGTLVASQNGKQRIDEIRDIFATGMSVVRAQLARRKQVQALSDARLTAVLLWGTLAASLLAFVIGAWILRELDRERLRGIRLAIQTAEHELFNQLTTASGHVQLVQTEPGLSEMQINRLAMARQSIERAVGVVRRMRQSPALRETIWKEAAIRTINFGQSA